MTPMMPPTSMRQGVPPRLCPTFQSWAMSPATPATQQTTVATPSTASTPVRIASVMVLPSPQVAAAHAQQHQQARRQQQGGQGQPARWGWRRSR